MTAVMDSTTEFPSPATPSVIALPFQTVLDMMGALRAAADDIAPRILNGEKPVATIRHAVDILDTAVQRAGQR